MSSSNGKPKVTPSNPIPDDYVAVDDFSVNHDPLDLIRFKGQWVAWSRDGRKVLFASPDPYKLCEMVDEAGLSDDDYVTDGIDAPWS